MTGDERALRCRNSNRRGSPVISQYVTSSTSNAKSTAVGVSTAITTKQCNFPTPSSASDSPMRCMKQCNERANKGELLGLASRPSATSRCFKRHSCTRAYQYTQDEPRNEPLEMALLRCVLNRTRVTKPSDRSAPSLYIAHPQESNRGYSSDTKPRI